MPTAPTRLNYTFDGWYREATLSTPWNFSTDVVTGNMTLYAKWVGIPKTVSFTVNGGTPINPKTVAYGDILSRPEDPVRYAYTFKGWYKDAAFINEWKFGVDAVTGNVTLYAKWTAVTHTVTFESGGGSAVARQVVLHDKLVVQPVAPTRGQDVFDGWYKEAAYTHAWNFAVDSITSNLTLYAKWTAVVSATYTLTFNADGGTVSISSKTVTQGAVVGTLPTPTRNGYTFGGWYTQTNGGGTPYTASTVYTATSSLTLYAKWTAVVSATYTLTFNADSGTVNPTSKTVTQGAAVGALPTPTRSGYAFDGWYTQVNGVGTLYIESTEYSASNSLTLYAKWIKVAGVTYTITFDAQGGTVSITSKTVPQGLTMGTLPIPTHSGGYAFGGWYTQVNGAGTLYTENTVPSGNVTLYAKWIQSTAVAAQEVSAIKLYPNPVANGELRIESEDLKTGERVEIYSLSGALVSTHEGSGAGAIINVSHLAAGVYLIKIGKQTAKVVVK
jgi:uncharacterized repeat protein (TIGR02543 family)